MSRPQFQWLGRVGYGEGLALQTELADKRHAGAIADTILLLEHEPVYTIGRTPFKYMDAYHIINFFRRVWR